MKITRIETNGDTLYVHGVDDEVQPDAEGNYPEQYKGQGWVTATTQHYDPNQYDPETGHLLPDQTPREMTDAEKQAYYLSLL